MTDMTDAPSTTAAARTFLLVTIAGSLTAWEIGFEYGAFDTVSYRRVFAVFIVSSVVLIATIVADDDTFATSVVSRAILGLPLLYLLADITFLTESQTVSDVLGIAVLASFPYTVWVVARILGTDYFTMPIKHQLVAAATVTCVAAAGWYVGDQNDRFLICSDFERVGDYQPTNCQP